MRIALVEFVLLMLVLGLALALAPALGINGVAIAWLGANAVVCAGLVPWLWRRLRKPAAEPGRPPHGR